MTSVIHIRNSNSKDDGQVYIGRDSRGIVPLEFSKGYFGNPIVKGKECPGCREIHKDNGDTLKCYSEYLEWRIANDSNFAARFLLLKDKTLVCYCRPKDGFAGLVICHGQIMAAKLDGKNPNEIG